MCCSAAQGSAAQPIEYYVLIYPYSLTYFAVRTVLDLVHGIAYLSIHLSIAPQHTTYTCLSHHLCMYSTYILPAPYMHYAPCMHACMHRIASHYIPPQHRTHRSTATHHRPRTRRTVHTYIHTYVRCVKSGLGLGGNPTNGRMNCGCGCGCGCGCCCERSC